MPPPIFDQEKEATMKTRVIAVLLLAALALVPGLAIAQVTPSASDVHGRFVGNGPAPAASSCGTAPVVVGNDSAGKVTIGTGTPSACTLTFSKAYTTGVSCSANDDTTIAKNPTTVITTTTTAVITLTAASVNGDVISYRCIGY